MGGVSGLGARSSVHAGTVAALDDLGLQVTPENVLTVRAVLLEEANELAIEVNKAREHVDIGLAGGDLISPLAREGFRELNLRLLARVEEYIVALRRAGENLRATAVAYGHTEAEVAASFGEDQVHPPVARSGLPAELLPGSTGPGSSVGRPPVWALGGPR